MNLQMLQESFISIKFIKTLSEPITLPNTCLICLAYNNAMNSPPTSSFKEIKQDKVGDYDIYAQSNNHKI